MGGNRLLAGSGLSEVNMKRAYRSQEVTQPPDDLGARLRVRSNDKYRLGEDEAFPEGPEGR